MFGITSFGAVPVPMEKWPPFYGGQMGVPGSDTPLGHRMGSGLAYYVDKNHPNALDVNDGTDPLEPKATIASAIAASNATINWTQDAYPYNWIFVAPGAYAEALTSLPHYCHIIGTGVLGTDGATEIHPAAGSAIAGTQINCRWSNIWFECETAVPVIDWNICNNVILEGCAVVRGIAGLATMGVQTTNASHLQIVNSIFCSGVADLPIGIQHLGGANRFAHCVRHVGNTIYAGTTGIDIPANCTASGALIAQNLIARPTTGIQDLNGGSWCVDNWISAGVDAINHANAGTHCIANHVLNNAVGAVEAAGTD